MKHKSGGKAPDIRDCSITLESALHTIATSQESKQHIVARKYETARGYRTRVNGVVRLKSL